MNQRLLKVGSYTLGAFAAISAFFQVLVLPLPYRIATFAATLSCGLGAFALMRKVQAHQNAMGALLRIIPAQLPDGPFAVRHIDDVAELRELWEIDDDSYGDASISLQRFEDWWRRYPAGLFALFRGEEIVGGIGIWPVCKTPFAELLNGRRRERDLTAKSIESQERARACPRWYVSGVVLVQRARKTDAVRVLLREAIGQWARERDTAVRIDLCALAYSPEGEALLRRFGFRKFKDSSETLDRYPMFALLGVAPSDIEGLVRRLKERRRWAH